MIIHGNYLQSLIKTYNNYNNRYLKIIINTMTAQLLLLCELKWSGGWSTGTVDWLSASEQDQYLDGCTAINTKCLVPLPFLPDLMLWSTENRSNGSPALVPPETQ